MIGTLAVQRGGAWAGCGPAQSPPRCTKCNSPPINGQCTNFILFDVALQLPLNSKGLKAFKPFLCRASEGKMRAESCCGPSSLPKEGNSCTRFPTSQLNDEHSDAEAMLQERRTHVFSPMWSKFRRTYVVTTLRLPYVVANPSICRLPVLNND